MDRAVRKNKLCKETVVTSSWHKCVREGHGHAYYKTVNRVHYHKFSSNSSVPEGRRKNSRLFDIFCCGKLTLEEKWVIV